MCPPIDADKKLLAPVFDRLQGSGKHTTSRQTHQIIRQLRESVRRDLEHLFNTRYRCVSAPANCSALEESLVNFGLPDLSSINLGAANERKKFCRQVEKAILIYEPRIKSVKVEGVTDIDPTDPAIRFRIEALLHANPVPEVIVFDSALNPVDRSVDISEIQR